MKQDYELDASNLALLHRVTKSQAAMLLEIVSGDKALAKRLCELVEASDFVTVYVCVGIGKSAKQAVLDLSVMTLDALIILSGAVSMEIARKKGLMGK